MTDKDVMLKGLKEVIKIIDSAKKTKSKPPIDIKDEKGMKKAIREIIGKQDGGVAGKFKPMGGVKKGSSQKDMDTKSLKNKDRFVFGVEIKDVDKHNEEVLKRAKKAREEAERKAKGMKDGGLAEAIEKVKKEDAVKMERGGMAPRRSMASARARGPRRMGFLGQAVDEFIETMEPFQGTVRKGETLRNVDGKTMVVRRMPNPNFIQREMMGEQGRMISDADRQMIMQMMGARRMADGGKVPAKFKGFSKLPEDVQEQMNPTLAKKFKKGGVVKMGKGGGVCKGMGIARAGGKFKLR